MTPYFSDESVTIYHGDCREVLPSLRADAVITDPPYGVDFRGAEWDASIPMQWLGLARAVAGSVLFTTGPLTLWDYPRPDWVLCWARPASNSRAVSGGFNHWTPVLVYGRRKFPVDLFSLHALAFASKFYDHPSPKPEPLMVWLVTHGSDPNETVLDPFMGSGTTLVAAKRLGRRAIGIELEEKYCEIAAQRLAQGSLFAAGRSVWEEGESA